MEEITDGVNNINITESKTKNRIQVSNTKKPLFFYVNLAKRYMQQYNEVELSALGMAIATVVTVAEILKNNGFAVEMKIMTSTVDMKDESRGRSVQKAKIEILLGKTAKFDELMAAQAEERERERERESGDVEPSTCLPRQNSSMSSIAYSPTSEIELARSSISPKISTNLVEQILYSAKYWVLCHGFFVWARVNTGL
ncbi:hypothetical protein CsSME_00007488 [Camellia sinensis var. sinensis]